METTYRLTLTDGEDQDQTTEFACSSGNLSQVVSLAIAHVQSGGVRVKAIAIEKVTSREFASIVSALWSRGWWDIKVSPNGRTRAGATTSTDVANWLNGIVHSNSESATEDVIELSGMLAPRQAISAGK